MTVDGRALAGMALVLLVHARSDGLDRVKVELRKGFEANKNNYVVVSAGMVRSPWCILLERFFPEMQMSSKKARMVFRTNPLGTAIADLSAYSLVTANATARHSAYSNLWPIAGLDTLRLTSTDHRILSV